MFKCSISYDLLGRKFVKRVHKLKRVRILHHARSGGGSSRAADTVVREITDNGKCTIHKRLHIVVRVVDVYGV